MSETITPPAVADTGAAPTTPAAEIAAPSWRDTLPDDLKAHPAAAKYATPADVLKGYIEAEKLIGRKGVIVPGEGASAEDVAAYRTALGVPETPEAYALKAPEGVLEGAWSDDYATAFTAKAHELGLTPAQVQGIAHWHAASTGQQMAGADEAAAAARAEAETALKGEWGASFDTKVEYAKRAVTQFGGQALADLLTETGLGNHPALVKAMAVIGERVAEDKPAGMGGQGGGVSHDPKARAMSIINDASSPYRNALHPEHRAAVQEVTRLLQEASA